MRNQRSAAIGCAAALGIFALFQNFIDPEQGNRGNFPATQLQH